MAERVRTFCSFCGTPLTFTTDPEGDEIDVTVSSFDQPGGVAPLHHTWTEDQLPWIKLADGLPVYQRDRT
jgi:hypothetical protein